MLISSIGFFWFEVDNNTATLYGISVFSTISIFWAYLISIKFISNTTNLVSIIFLTIVLLINIFLVFINSQNIFDILIVFFSIYFIYRLKQKMK